jgi:hypothetical protein
MINNSFWKMERHQLDKALGEPITDEEWKDWQAHERELERLLIKSIATGKNHIRGKR